MVCQGITQVILPLNLLTLAHKMIYKWQKYGRVTQQCIGNLPLAFGLIEGIYVQADYFFGASSYCFMSNWWFISC